MLQNGSNQLISLPIAKVRFRHKPRIKGHHDLLHIIRDIIIEYLSDFEQNVNKKNNIYYH